LLIDALRGAGAALETVASIALMCEPRDIGRTLGSEDGPIDHEGYRPTLFLYDALPGGVGLARRIFERAEELFSRARRLIAGCGCKSGCPACIGAAILSEPQPSAAPTLAPSARKAAALALLEGF
jgi:DEAD/DEAH box helicase domain-containing protein